MQLERCRRLALRARGLASFCHGTARSVVRELASFTTVHLLRYPVVELPVYLGQGLWSVVHDFQRCIRGTRAKHVLAGIHLPAATSVAQLLLQFQLTPAAQTKVRPG